MVRISSVRNFIPDISDNYTVRFECPFSKDINILDKFIPSSAVQFENLNIKTTVFSVNKWEIEVPILITPFPKKIILTVVDNDHRKIITDIRDYYHNHKDLRRGRVPLKSKDFLSKIYLKKYDQTGKEISLEAYKFYVSSAGQTLYTSNRVIPQTSLEMVITGIV